MNTLKKTLVQGLKVTIPILITIAIVVWLVSSIESFFRVFLLLFIPQKYYFKGMGAIFGLTLVFVIGLLMNAWVVSKLYSWGESLIKKVPVVKTIYSALQDMMAFFGDSDKENKGSAVVVEFEGFRLLGFITREDYAELGLKSGPKDEVTVYIPMSYQMGGFTILISSSCLKPIALSSQDTMRFILTAGVGKKSAN